MSMRCVILCNGPTLGEIDLRKIDCMVIGINKSYIKRRSDIHVFTCGKLLEAEGSKLMKATSGVRRRFNAAIKYPFPGCFTPKKIQHLNGTTFREGRRLAVLPTDYDVYRDGWIFCGGGPCALQIAISFDFNEIIFCGLDLHLTNRGASVQIDFFRQFKSQLDARGVKVYNASLDSAEGTFEKRPFDSFWGTS